MADLAVPAGCLTCGDWFPRAGAGELLCGRCRTRLPSAPWPRCERCHFPRGTGRADAATCRACHGWPASLTRARFAHVLREPASDVVHALKYEGWIELGPLMGAALARALAPEAGRRTIVTFVPTTEARVRQRGYNQAEVLARAYGELCSVPVEALLDRASASASQTTLHPAERVANVAGAFRPKVGARRVADGAHVVLVDDVLTTGATASAAATALCKVGAASVTLLAYARALPDSKRDAA